jgi:hypothetical protein
LFVSFFFFFMTEQKILKNGSNKRQTFVTSAMRCCGCGGTGRGNNRCTKLLEVAGHCNMA